MSDATDKADARRLLGAPCCRILDAMVWLETGRIPMPWHRTLVAYAAGHLPRAGGFKSCVAVLHRAELLCLPGTWTLAIEGEGARLAAGVEPDAGFTRERFWKRLDEHLGPVERAIAIRLRSTPMPGPVFYTKPQLLHAGNSLHAPQHEVEVTPANFRTAIAKLIAADLVDIVQPEVYVARQGTLFPVSVFEIREAKATLRGPQK